MEDVLSDQILITRLIQSIRHQDYNIHKATTLADSLQILSKHHIDIVLLDLKLPDSSGLDTFDNINRSYPNTPVIIMTGEKVEEEIALVALEKGAQDYLEKDKLSSAILRKAIQYAIKRKEMVRGLENAQRLGKLGFWEVNPYHMSWQAAPFTNELLGRTQLNPITKLSEFLDMVHPEERQVVKEKLRAAAVIKKPFEHILRVILKDGQEKLISLQGKAVLDHENSVRHLEGTIQDISDRQKLRIAEQEKELAQKKAKLRQEFLAKTSHEIRTPLNPILLLTDLLLDDKLSSEQRKHISTIKYAASTLLALVNDILDLSKIEAGKIAFDKKPFSIPILFDQIKDLLNIYAENKRLYLNFNIKGHVPRFVSGDVVRLSQILINLNSNAIKFTTDGSVSTTVSVHKEEEKLIWLKFEVADTGIGIPKDQLDRIFNSFEQLKSRSQIHSEGTGLGLTIVRQLVHLQGGDISVQSELGKGSTFSFIMPFKIHQTQLPLKLENQNEAPNPQFEDERDLNGLRILLVEDDPLNQLVTEKLLDRWNASVRIANHGQEGLELLQKHPFDLVLMDIQMPIMDGLETSKAIRNTLLPPVRDIPIIALTANAISGSDDECFTVGMNDYVSKPIETDIFYRKLVSYKKGETEQLQSDLDLNEAGAGVGPEAQNAIQSSMATDRYTDLSALTDMYGGDQMLVKKTVSKIVDKVPEYLNDLNNYRADENFKKVSEVIHKLKANVVGYMGINEFSESSLDFLIQNIKNNEISIDELDSFLKKFNEVVNAGIEELKADLDSFV
ncbi:MAG: response regulator [Bacteroidia bacterium]|nr:response regulator [Bacteroidia bacterium]